MIRLFLPALALAAAVWASRVVNPAELGARFERMEDRIRSWGPLVAALLTAAVVWWTWGYLNPLPVTHDEGSYVLQADIFARFAWTAPAPSIPEFFEQPQVLVVPAVASKFPPGHALLLALGALLHFPPLVPLLVAGGTAALIMAVAARVANPWVSVVTWLVWLTTPMVLRFQAGYFAEPTETLALLAAWWSLLVWRESRRRRWIAAMAGALGWAAITEPVAAAAFALPLLVVMLSDMIRGRRWIDFLAAVGAGAAVLSIFPLWAARTTGNPRLTPTALYRSDYVPFDRPGFTLSSEAPRRMLSPVQEAVRDDLLQQQEGQLPHRLPGTLTRRLGGIVGGLWQGAQLALVPFFLVGLFAMNGALRVGVISAGCLILARVPFAQDPAWALSYLPVAPVVAGLTGYGAWRVLVWAASGVVVRLHIDRRPKLGSALVALVLAFFAVPTFSTSRTRHQQGSAMRSAFDEAMKQLPSSKSIIFLSYAPRRQHMALVSNHPDLQKEPVWVVHDLGERNRELTRLAQDRTAYVFDEQTMEFRRF